MSEPIKNQVTLLPQPADMTPMQMLQVAVSNGVDTEQIKQLMDLQREWKADRAREAFVQAMTAFRAEPLKVGKDKHVRYVSKRTGDVTEYNHATLAQVVDAAVVALSRHGLAHRWETKQEGNLISVACILTHVMGHSERVSLSAPADDSGGKNSIQAVGSTVTYLQRYTLMAITGLAAKDQDDDGRGSEAETVTIDQATAIKDKIAEVKTARPKFSEQKFLEWLKAETVDAILAKDFERALVQLQKNIPEPKAE